MHRPGSPMDDLHWSEGGKGGGGPSQTESDLKSRPSGYWGRSGRRGSLRVCVSVRLKSHGKTMVFWMAPPMCQNAVHVCQNTKVSLTGSPTCHQPLVFTMVGDMSSLHFPSTFIKHYKHNCFCTSDNALLQCVMACHQTQCFPMVLSMCQKTWQNMPFGCPRMFKNVRLRSTFHVGQISGVPLLSHMSPNAIFSNGPEQVWQEVMCHENAKMGNAL